MADSTRRFKLTTLDQPTDRLDYENYKFSAADRVLLDRLLRFAVENHTHTGETVTITPASAPQLGAQRGGGTIPANRAVYYCYSIVDARGQESLASKVATVYTPPQVPAPLAGPQIAAIAGTLDGGDYLYAVSASTGTSGQETLLSPTAAGTLSAFGGWEVTLPRPPSGGEFFNVYRKGPRDDELHYVGSTGAEDTTYIDDGSVAVNRFRRSPQTNTTYSANSVLVTLPEHPDGTWTWRLYRTFDPSSWNNSLLEWIGPTDTYVDDGQPSRAGVPPRASAAVGGAPKIRLNTETEGFLPPGILTTTRIANFTQDEVTVGASNWNWVSEYAEADPYSMRATLGRDCPPAGQDVHVGLDVHLGTVWQPITNGFLAPLISVIPVGETVGSLVDLYNAAPNYSLIAGNRLRSRVYQTGGGATPTDRDLSLTVTLAVRHGSTSQTYQWETD